MREIKFRAWDSKNKEFVYEFYINSNRTDYIQIIPEYLNTRRDSFIMTTNDDYELNQFTGLKDKNGKEIYDGDILMNRFSPGREERLVLTHDIFFIIHRLRTLQHERKNDLNQTLEIIGNVYESPELLSTQPSQE